MPSFQVTAEQGTTAIPVHTRYLSYFYLGGAAAARLFHLPLHTCLYIELCQMFSFQPAATNREGFTQSQPVHTRYTFILDFQLADSAEAPDRTTTTLAADQGEPEEVGGGMAAFWADVQILHL